MFSSFIEHPQNCSFEGQNSEEKILLLLRAHLITNIPWIIGSIFVFLLPFIIPRLLSFIGFSPFHLPPSFILIFLIINYLLVLIIVFEGFLNWYFNVTLITDQKVIDIDFQLLYKGVDLAPLSKIEEADSVTAGVIGTFFNFGNVSIQTAGATVAIEMKNIPKPAIVADIILDLIGKPHQHLEGVPHI